MKQPYAEKYRPKNTSSIQGHNKAIEEAKEFIESFPKKKKGLLLYGPPGTGKTSLAHALATEYGYELVEVNASDTRNKRALIEHVEHAMKQRSLFGNQKLILFDEVDGLSGRKDRGGISTMIDLLKASPYPVILTANDPWNKKFNTLRRHVEMLELQTLRYTSVFSVLQAIAEKENILYEEEALKTLARRSGGDLRGAITDLETLGQDKLIDQQDLESLGERRKAESMFNALKRIFKGTDALIARQAVDIIDEDIDELMLWVDENIPREYTKAEDIAAAYKALARADQFKGRIMRWQHWRFLVYVIDHLTAGVALAKQEKYSGYTKYQRTQRLLKYWRANQANKKKDAIAQKIGEETHTSIKEARDTLPYIARMIQKDKSYAEAFDLGKDEVKWLIKSFT